MTKIVAATIHDGLPGPPGPPSVTAGSVALTDGQFPLNVGGTLTAANFTAQTRSAMGAWIVVGDGTDQTTVLLQALQSANSSATAKIVRIIGTVLVNWHAYSAADSAVCTLYAGCTLEGIGRSSVLKARAASAVNGTNGYLLRRQSNTMIRNLAIDGDRATVNPTLSSVTAFNAVYGKDNNLANPQMDTFWIHDIPGYNPGGSGAESFGVTGGDYETDPVLRNGEVWNVSAGSGVGFAGDPNGTIEGATRSLRGVLENVRCHDCDWQGMTLYGCDDFRFYDCAAYNNGHGFNVEGSTGNRLFSPLAYANEVNLFLLGDSGVQAWSPRFFAATSQEIVVASGSFSGGATKVARQLDLFAPSVTPSGSNPHLLIQVNPITTSGVSVPSIQIFSPDAVTWTISQNNTTGGHPRGGLTRPGAVAGTTVTLGKTSTWTLDSGLTAPAYTGGGNLGPNPVTLTATATFLGAVSPYNLVANHTYLVRGRVKILEQKIWEFYLLASPNTIIYQPPYTAGDVGQWITFEVIVKPTVSAALRWDSDNNSTNTLVVDYLTVAEVPLQPGMGE